MVVPRDCEWAAPKAALRVFLMAEWRVVPKAASTDFCSVESMALQRVDEWEL